MIKNKMSYLKVETVLNFFKKLVEKIKIFIVPLMLILSLGFIGLLTLILLDVPLIILDGSLSETYPFIAYLGVLSLLTFFVVYTDTSFFIMNKLKLSLVVGLQIYGNLILQIPQDLGLGPIPSYLNLPVVLIGALFYYPLESIKMTFLFPIVFVFGNLIFWVPIALWINSLVENYQKKKKAGLSS